MSSSARGGAEVVALSGSVFRTPADRLSSGIDAAERDAHRTASLNRRLDTLIRQPALFSAEFATLSLAEREIWLRNLVQHARGQGRGQEAVDALNGTQSPVARKLAIAFAAQLEGAHPSNVASLVRDSGDGASR